MASDTDWAMTGSRRRTRKPCREASRHRPPGLLRGPSKVDSRADPFDTANAGRTRGVSVRLGPGGPRHHGLPGWHTRPVKSPPVRFATTTDGVRIAYTVWGDGPTFVIAPPIISNVELAWEHDQNRRVFERMGRHVTAIAFDKRGIGMSDRFDQPPTNEHRITDFLAVMDAEGIEKANISGISEGGAMAQLLAVAHPDRVDRLVISNSSAPPDHRDRVRELADGPLLSFESFMARWNDVILHWGEADSPAVPWIMPSMANDPVYREWFARFQRHSATQAGFRRQLESIALLDTTGVPEQIQAPTLVTHTTGDQVLNAAHGRTLAELIPGATYVEFPGPDHFFWIAPNWRDILDEHLRFVIGGPVGAMVQRSFATVLFTDLVGSTAAASSVGDARWSETLDQHDRLASRVVAAHSGRLVKSTGDGMLATFPSPSLAVMAATALRAELGRIDLMIRAGLHAGEIEDRDGDISGFAVNLAARVEGAAPDGEIFVTSTVRDLLLGGSFAFEDAGVREFKGIQGAWALCRLT